MPTSGIIALLTDFGRSDVYVGVMKGVMLGIAPRAQLVDLTHDVPPQDLATAAWLLCTAWRSFPAETVFVAVVDPGVGTARRPVAIYAGGRYLVGPDNGIFGHALAAEPAERAVVLDAAAYYATPQPSATFHGRDVFAPCAAHLVAGVPLESLGSPLAPADLVRLAEQGPAWRGGTLVAHAIYVDHFGNIITDLGPELTDRFLAQPTARAVVGSRTITARAITFGEGPEREPFLLRDSSGQLAIAVRDGSAAAALGVGRGDVIEVIGLRPLA
jgi:S-adenosylmethionine hydrolase